MFNEKDHPRDSDGKFTDGSGHSDSQKVIEATQKYSSDPNQDLATTDVPRRKGNGKTQDEFFGEEFTGVKGADAIEKLLKEKRGHVKNAFERPEIGGIDLVWGDDTGGLQHTIMRRDEQLNAGTGTTSGINMVRLIPEIIEKGDFSLGVGDRPNFTMNGYLVVIRPTFDGKKVNWVLTAMEPQKNKLQ